MSALPFPIFVLAPPRSFTTLVTGMLAQHPQIYGGPELTVFFRPTLRKLWRQGRGNKVGDTRVRHGLLRLVAEIYFGAQTDEAVQGAEHWCALRQDLPIAEVFDELRAKLVPFHILEKSPDYTIEPDSMLAIHKACPDARYLFLTRHPVTQGKSVLSLNDGIYPLNANALDFSSGQGVYDPQIAWHDQSVNTLNFLEQNIEPDRYMKVKGEKLMANPRRELVVICRWLGLRDDDGSIGTMLEPERSPFASFGPISALFGNDPNFLRNPYFAHRKAAKLPDLESPLPWREDGVGLRPEVVALAKEFGY
jgi:hypothetical protein